MNAASIVGQLALDTSALLLIGPFLAQLTGTTELPTGTTFTTTNYQTVPLTESPSQIVTLSLGGQPCRIKIYTRSINVPIEDPAIYTNPPTYENINPVFCDLYVNDVLIIGGVICQHGNRIVRNSYLGFVGDLAFFDTQATNGAPPLSLYDLGAGGNDPVGVPARLPPPFLRNWWQKLIPLRFQGRAPSNLAGKIPGLGTRFILTFWPAL